MRPAKFTFRVPAHPAPTRSRSVRALEAVGAPLVSVISIVSCFSYAIRAMPTTASHTDQRTYATGVSFSAGFHPVAS